MSAFAGFPTPRKLSDSSKPSSPGDAISDETRRETDTRNTIQKLVRDLLEVVAPGLQGGGWAGPKQRPHCEDSGCEQSMT